MLAALALTVTCGATLGMINLARLTWTLGFLSQPSVWAHAYVQVFGFVGLFVMGVATHVVPRFGGTELRSPRLMTWAFGLQVAGIVACASAFCLADPVMRPVWIAGATLLLGGALVFLDAMRRTVAASKPAPEMYAPWVVAGSWWLVVVSALTVVAAITNDSTWHLLMWPAALFGFASSWIFGIGRRVFVVFLGWRPGHAGCERRVFRLYQAAVVLWTAGSWPAEHVAIVSARLAGAAALAAATVGCSIVLGALRRPSPATPGFDVSPRRFVYAAWVWLAIGIAAGPIYTIGATLRGGYGSIIMLDFARHAVAFGFVTQVIMGVAMRVLPVFSGRRLWSRRAQRWSFYLLNAGIALRGLEAVVASGLAPWAWPLIALSGPPAAIAVALFAANIAMTVTRPGATVPAAPPLAVAAGGRRVLQATRG